jgi:cytochrome bd-type quinol oxidase subunit 2
VIVGLTIGGLVVAVVLGVALKYATASRHPEKQTEGADVVKVLGSTSLIAGLLVGFVLAGASSSYTSARNAAKAEADTVDTLFESAEYVKQPFRQRLQGAAVCYARAVAGPGFDAMAHGDESPVPANWTGTQPGGIRRTLINMTPAAVGFGDVRSADVTRGAQRSERLAQAQSTVPNPLYALMVVLLALSLGTLAYSIPRRNNLEELVALGLVTVIFGVVLVLIANFDRPFSGIL